MEITPSALQPTTFLEKLIPSHSEQPVSLLLLISESNAERERFLERQIALWIVKGGEKHKPQRYSRYC